MCCLTHNCKNYQKCNNICWKSVATVADNHNLVSVQPSDNGPCDSLGEKNFLAGAEYLDLILHYCWSFAIISACGHHRICSTCFENLHLDCGVCAKIVLQPLRWCCVDCVIHHERDVREEQHHTYMWREQAINRVIMACELYCCLLPQCEALRICRSGFPIATIVWQWLDKLWNSQFAKPPFCVCTLIKQSMNVLFSLMRIAMDVHAK